MTDQEARWWADLFWRLVGRSESFPRSLESSIAWGLPLAVVKLPHLGLDELRTWLSSNGIRVQIAGSNRPLRAFLIARAGRGLIVLDGTDAEDEQRISLAHECSHFLMDYWHPRHKALRLLGEGATDVLDGLRAPTVEERLRGVLRGVQLGVYAHLVVRSISGEIEHLEALGAEDRADRLALELLAPRQVVIRRLGSAVTSGRADGALQAATEILMDEFGLPRSIAEQYGRSILAVRRAARSFREWLGTS